MSFQRLAIAFALALALVPPVVSAQEGKNAAEDLFFLPMASYDYLHLDNQEAHIPAIGLGVMKGEMDAPFTEAGRRFFTLLMYQPVFFQDEIVPGYSRTFHQIDFLFDGRIGRQQFFGLLKSASDKPLAGGLHTFQAGAGWGYEFIRRPNVSLIVGAVLCVGDFGVDLPNGEPLPLAPLPLVRFGLDTRLLDLSFDFLTGPNLSFTISPESRIRFSGDMRMDYYRSLGDILCEYTLWYRFFPPEHKLGDFAGIGIGLKNESLNFDLSADRDKILEIQNASVFATLDFSFLKLSGGYIFDSRLLVDEVQRDKREKGFYFSVQAVCQL
jgi:hypothetical protein